MILAFTVAMVMGAQKSSALIQQMFQHYHDARSLTGKMTATISASFEGTSVEQVTTSVIQFEKPSKFYLRQEQLARPGHPGQVWLVTSDGVHFSYNVPNAIDKAQSSRLIEAVSQPDRGEVLDVPHLYAVASQSLGDRSAPIGIAVSWAEELRRVLSHWATIEPPIAEAYRGVSGFRIQGDFRQKPTVKSDGRFQLFISNEGDLLFYSETERVGLLSGPDTTATSVSTAWDIDFHVNGSPDPSLFKVVVR